ncbi:MAG: thioredoxin-disulfide reductase [Candidatus Omnitrophica bacterium]|nr:thioredoxin-disulfide reductase [Candidatus Omnitrophota bacterium]
MHDVIIIGSGPAGLTAALYCARFGLKTMILEKMVAGGQILLSERIENFPGFFGGISTQELIERMKRQIEELKVGIEIDQAQEIIPEKHLQSHFFNVRGKYNSYTASSIIIASGASPRKLNVKGEDKFIGRGVSYCGTCDGPLFKGKEVVVIGGGNTAIEEALFLTNYAAKVSIIHRRQQFRAAKILEEKARANPKINFILDSVIDEITGQDKPEAVVIRNVKTNSTSCFSCQGVFIFVGIEPNTGFVKNLLNIDESGFIMTDQSLHTSKEGVFACGDCLKKGLYQVINACGEGALAADSAHKYLLSRVK